VKSSCIKLSPKAVSCSCVVEGAFTGAIAVTTGASKVSKLRKLDAVVDDPTRSATVTVRDLTLPEPALALQSKLDDELQLIVAHWLAPRVAEGVPSAKLKLRPSNVRLFEPDTGILGADHDVVAGASYVNAAVMVPTVLPTVIARWCEPPVPTGVAHRRVVAVAHAAEAHAVVPTCALTVEPMEPKLKPNSVRIAFDETGPFFGAANVVNGESKEKDPKRHPTSSSTTMLIGRSDPNPICVTHETVVPDVQDDVMHCVRYPTADDGVLSKRPKFAPFSVRDKPAVVKLL